MEAVESLRRAPLPPPPGGLPLAVFNATETEQVEAADYLARHWRSPAPGRLRPGSAEHRQAVARMFQETFNPYRPSVIDWPVLSAAARDRLVSLPIWDIAVQTEGKASQNMQSYADSEPDPDWKLCVQQNAWEERRHKVVLHDMVKTYGIRLEPEPPYPAPRDTQWAYLVTGYSECIDSFFAFGLYVVAQRSGMFPEPLVAVFEPVMQEECRHILLFANWVAAHRAGLNPFQRIWFELRVLAVWVFLAWERMGIARGMDSGDRDQPAPAPQDNNFTLTGSKAVSDQDLSIGEVLRTCLAENDRRFAGYDERLLRPTTVPALARFALRFIR